MSASNPWDYDLEWSGKSSDSYHTLPPTEALPELPAALRSPIQLGEASSSTLVPIEEAPPSLEVVLAADVESIRLVIEPVEQDCRDCTDRAGSALIEMTLVMR